ncbi:MAG: DUF1294 domain-containing protein [Ruminococcus sp.]|nr:DUF1294 domain-containing protein [Ruminococcus sp.]
MALLALLAYFALMSLVTFILYATDKKRAMRGQWRVREATLLGAGLIGGAAGGLLGMETFRHKTKHWYFWLVNIGGFALHVCAVYFLAKQAGIF